MAVLFSPFGLEDDSDYLAECQRQSNKEAGSLPSREERVSVQSKVPVGGT